MADFQSFDQQQVPDVAANQVLPEPTYKNPDNLTSAYERATRHVHGHDPLNALAPQFLCYRGNY